MPRLTPPDDHELFGREEQVIVDVARHALRHAIDQFAPAGANKLALAAVAVSGMFADLVGGLASAPAIVEVVNKQLAAAGLEVVEIERN
jgi:hypothetical protein